MRKRTKKKVTMTTIANATGFTTATVSNVLSGKKGAGSEDTRRKIIECARVLGYVPKSGELPSIDEVDETKDTVYDPFAPVCAEEDMDAVSGDETENGGYGVTGLTMDDIRFYREAQGWSQQEFASTFGIPVTTYCQWESGRRTPPPYVLNMIAQTTQLSPDLISLWNRDTIAFKIEDAVKQVFKAKGCNIPIDFHVELAPIPNETGLEYMDGFYLVCGTVSPANHQALLSFLQQVLPDDLSEEKTAE